MTSKERVHAALRRETVKPRMKRIFDVGKRHDLRVAYHCCGAMRDIIPDLIDIGLDVLNPIQCNCEGAHNSGTTAPAQERVPPNPPARAMLTLWIEQPRNTM